MSELFQTPIDSQAMRSLVARMLHEEFARIQPMWVERHLRLLVSLRETFGNDLDKPIILAVIGQVMFSNMPELSNRYEDILNGAEYTIPTQLTNVESIASSTGIPRESVRRKIGELIDIGWLTRDAKGGLFVTDTAAKALDGGTQSVFRLLGDMFQLMALTLADRGDAVMVRPARDEAGG